MLPFKENRLNMNINKLNYFKKRNENLKKDAFRNSRANKEINTLKSLLYITDQDFPFKEKIKKDKQIDFLHNKFVVDLGCGDKYLEEPIKNSGAKYLGLDFEDLDLEIGSVPISDNSVDIVISLAVIEHLFNPGLFLNEIYRILTPGGLLWLSTPDINACKYSFWDDPTHIHPYNPKSMRFLLNMNGFSYIKITPNYLSKSPFFYKDSKAIFTYSRIIPFKGNSKLPVPEIFKGKCSGLFAIARKV